MKLVIKTTAMTRLLDVLQNNNKNLAEALLQKAAGHKYIYRRPAKRPAKGRKWDYVYPEDLLHPIKTIKKLWGIDENRFNDDYKKNNIKKDFGADKKTFAAHILEYFTNKMKWDLFFSKKENRKKTEKPVRMKAAARVSTEKLGDASGGQAELAFEKRPKKADNESTLNRSLMRKVYNIYNKMEGKDNDREKWQDNALFGPGELSAGTPAVRTRRSEAGSDKHVSGGEASDNGSESLQPTVDTGGRSERDVRVSKKQAQGIREACLKLLAEKADDQMSEVDKALLRGYEGAGGLGEDGASANGTLYEFYTPQKVVNKVWDIVNKYAGSGKKNVLEPSAGIGRFAEGRDDNFTLCELDKTSARISKILHPNADVKQGAFQEMFMPDGVAKKDYTGKKYDVVIGNPPYGGYQGLYKGRGEGKEHKRYEEYFIDRGLDTLREGGVLALVVPSSFLRGGASKIKEKIAGKGKLLEAWRLPNGTFNSTGVGTDIIILRKEKGIAADFADNAYFEKNPAMIIGDETTRNGRFGAEQYVALKDGETFDQALDRIRADAVQAVPMGDKTDAERAIENVKIEAEPAPAQDKTARPSRVLSSLIPLSQLQVIRETPDAYSDSIAALNEKVKRIPKLYSGENLKERSIALHYFTGGTDIYVTEWDGKDTFSGYTILNGDTQNAEWGYSSLSEMMSVPSMNLDYDTDLGTVEAALKKRELAVEAHENRSQAMAGNQNAKKYGMSVGAVGNGKYGIRIGEDLWIAANPPDRNGIGAMFAGRAEFDGVEAAKEYMNDYADRRDAREQKRNQKTAAVLEKNRAWIKAAIRNGGKREGKYLIDTKTGGRLELNTANMDLYNEIVSEDEAYRNRTEAMAGNNNARKESAKEAPSAGNVKTDSIAEFNKKYNRNIPPQSLPVWENTGWDGKIDISTLSKEETQYVFNSGNYVIDREGKWMDKINFASGNIYQKLNKLEEDRAVLGEKNYKAQKELLEAAKPQPKKIGSFTLSPLTEFAKSFTVKGVDGEPLGDLRDAFIKWACNGRAWFDIEDAPLSQLEIGTKINFGDIQDYIYQKPVIAERASDPADRETNKKIADQTRDLRKEAAERIFNRFIREGLGDADQKRLELEYNRRFNAVVNPDYTQIPIFVDGIAQTHHGKPLNIKDQQLKGVSFLSNKGNGLIAYDVGVGKTMVGVMATVSQVQSGRAKKPLVCVPKAVYKNWIKNFHNLFPGVKINELGNLSKRYVGSGELNIAEGTISVCTYEALQNITFKKETVMGELMTDILESQQTEAGREVVEQTASNPNASKQTQRQASTEEEKIMTMLGMAVKNKDAVGKGARFWEDIGFDHITVDEVHTFKSVFASAKPQQPHADLGEGDEKEGRVANEFQGLTGSQSARGLKMFAITQLIQKNNNDRNVFALSATPFTNSPIEIYNILSLVARKKLKDMGVYNLHEFMAQFAELKSDWVYKAKGEIERSQVMKNFQNLSALQALITEYIDKVDGEEAGIIRPRKKTHITQLRTTDLQKRIIAIETERMTKATKDDKGATLVALNNMRMAMLSPAFLKGDEKYAGVKLPGPEEVVTSSPKLQFTCHSVVDCYKANPKNSQIIYMPRGTAEYTFVKQYLVEQGIPPEAIAFMNSKTSLDAKEKIKNDFNDKNGTIKVIIGSETIKEGVSLNGNTTTIYNTCLGWNPTETIQVEGRAWRQGNEQGHVHIVYPLMNDSVDSFIYQKHDEKSSRLDAIYSFKGDKLNVEDIDPEELKFALIKDPEKRAKFKIDMEKEEISAKQSTLQAQLDILIKNVKRLSQAESIIGSYEGYIKDYEKELVEAKADYDEYKKEVDKLNKAKRPVDWQLQSRMERAQYNVTRLKNNIRDSKSARKDEQDAIDAIHAKFDKMGIKKQADVERKERQMQDEIKIYGGQLGRIEKNRKEYIKEARKQIAMESVEARPLKELIKENVNSIITDLRPMNEVTKEIEAERTATMGKSILVFIRRRKAAWRGEACQS
jgi:hypothetical protein